MKTTELVEILKVLTLELRKSNNIQTKQLTSQLREIKKEMNHLRASNLRLLKEVKSQNRKPITEQRVERDIDDIIGDVLTQERQEVQPTNTNSTQYTPDNMLNNILNETARTADLSDMYDPHEQASVQTLNTFTSNDTHTMPALTSNQVNPNLISKTDAEGRPVNLKNVPEKVIHNIAGKDYGAIMDKMLADQKAKGKG